MTIRVVQWTTGNVGKQSAIAIARNPGLELVGCYAWSPDKVGRDVGELCGLDPLGVTATHDVDALLALHPDCVVYNPMWPSIDELVRILGAGVNVVTTAAFINGRRLGPDRERLVEACERGGSSLFGTGINPGFIELLSIVVAGVCDRIDKITVNESAHTMGYDSPATEKAAGFGRPIDDPELQRMTAEGTAVFGEAVAMVADALGVELDDGGVRGRVREDDGGPRSRLVADRGGVRGRCRRQLAGPGGRPDRDRAERAVEEGADARARLDRSRTGTSSRCRDVRPCGRPCSFFLRRTSRPSHSRTSWCWATS